MHGLSFQDDSVPADEERVEQSDFLSQCHLIQTNQSRIDCRRVSVTEGG
jgi:hypothetical protein